MKFFFTFLLSAILLLTVASCNRDNDNGSIPPVIPVSGITLNQISATLVVGDTLFLSATVQPADATNQNIGWSTATGVVSVVGGMVIADSVGTPLFVRKPSIAVDGMVIANSVGVADIVVTTGDGNHTATSVVTVVTASIPVENVSLNETTATLTVGDSLSLTATILPENATNRNVSWSSNNPAVVTVNSTTGAVTAISAGEATITVTTEDGNHTATCVVTVTPPVSVTGVTLDKTSTTLVVGNNPLTLTATVLPENATNKNITWSSSNPGVATVDNNGVVTVISVGVSRITATTVDGNHTASCGIAVVATQQGCNQNTPGWGKSLGTVTFHSQGHNVVVSGNGITQTWSGAVTATNCQKTTFAGGSTGNFNADCRSNNSGFPGDLFSWCAVVRFADELCPYPWRVPTLQDFIDLDIAMGGNGNIRGDTPQFVQDNYITRWGGAFGGYCSSDGTLLNQGIWGIYWSQTENYATNGRILFFSTSGNISPQGWNAKVVGLTLRCVR